MDTMTIDIHFREYSLKMLDTVAPKNLADKLVHS
jgi:hypothetical protein